MVGLGFYSRKGGGVFILKKGVSPIGEKGTYNCIERG